MRGFSLIRSRESSHGKKKVLLEAMLEALGAGLAAGSQWLFHPLSVQGESEDQAILLLFEVNPMEGERVLT